MMGGLMFQSRLDAVLRETAILRVGYLSRAVYEIHHHEAMAAKLGFTAQQMAAIERGAADSSLTAAQQAVLAFTDDLVLRVKAGDATLAAVREILDTNQLMDLMATIGAYMTLARILETTGVPVEDRPSGLASG
jgi:alkylhydroperoxidase family enzyme